MAVGPDERIVVGHYPEEDDVSFLIRYEGNGDLIAPKNIDYPYIAELEP